MTSTIALVRHRVADFDAWKKEYDAFAPVQAEHGVNAHQVLRSIEDPNDVTVTHTFDSQEAARDFFAMAELKEAMGQAGVDADSVEISYFDEVESGALVGA
jgi:heme-degrading monooxygenase HmoA